MVWLAFPDRSSGPDLSSGVVNLTHRLQLRGQLQSWPKMIKRGPHCIPSHFPWTLTCAREPNVII